MARPYREALHPRTRDGRFDRKPGVVSPAQTERLLAAAAAEVVRSRPLRVDTEDGQGIVPYQVASDRAVWIARRRHLEDADELRLRFDGRYPTPEEMRRSAAMAEVLGDELRDRGHDDPDDPEIGRRPLRPGEKVFDAVAHLGGPQRDGAVSVLDSHGTPVPVSAATNYQLYWGRQGRLAAAEAVADDSTRVAERQRWEREAVEIAEELDGRGFDNPEDPVLARQVVARDDDDREVALVDATPRQLYWGYTGRLWAAEDYRFSDGPYDDERLRRTLDEAREFEMEMRHRGLDPGDRTLGAPEARPGSGGADDSFCSLCGGSIRGYGPEELADHHVYKLGELDAIEVAHGSCARHDPRFPWEGGADDEEEAGRYAGISYDDAWPPNHR